jgi:hypothetical protein
LSFVVASCTSLGHPPKIRQTLWSVKTLSHCGFLPICRRNRVLAPDTDDAEKTVS